jgi:hypothetical protein
MIWLYYFISGMTRPRNMVDRNGLYYLKSNKTSCDNEHCATVYHYFLMGQNEWGLWVKVREVEFTEELK